MPRLPEQKTKKTKKNYVLFDNLKNDHLIRAPKLSPNEIFMFLINPLNEKRETQKLIAEAYVQML